MSRWYFYDETTGLLSGRVLTGPESLLADNTPPGHVAIEVSIGAVLDPRNRRVNLQTGEIEPYRPEPPPDDELRTWAWDDAAERWRPAPTAAALAQQRVRELQLQIDAAELAQARPQRELLLAIADGKAAPAEAVAKLAEIEAAAVALRAEIGAAGRR